MGQPNLNILTPQEFSLLQDKDPQGVYDRETREDLYQIIQKLGDNPRRCSRREKKIYKKFAGTNFGILLRQGTESHGKILHSGEVNVEGFFEGTIVINGTLTVEPSGMVLAAISAGSVICRGRIEGDIQAMTQVSIFEGGQVFGNIFTPSIHIEEGAVFEGRSSMPQKPDEIIIHETQKNKTLRITG